MLKFTPLTQGLLAILYECLTGREGKWLSVPSISEGFPVLVSDDYVRTALDELLRKQWAEYDADRDAIAISVRGINYAEKQLEKEDSLIAEYHRLGIDDFFLNYGGDPRDTEKAASFESATIKSNKDADLDADAWEPLPLDRDSDSFKQALEASEEAEKIIREDNGFAANYPELRENILWSVGSAINRMREGLITFVQMKTMLIGAFEKVANLFAEGLLKEAAKKAAEKLWVLIS